MKMLSCQFLLAPVARSDCACATAAKRTTAMVIGDLQITPTLRPAVDLFVLGWHGFVFGKL